MFESPQQNPISARRRSLKTKGITCPEGIWVLEAMILYSDRTWGVGKWGDQKAGDIAQNLIEFFLETPSIEVFTIDSYNGSKEPIDRDYLRSRTAVKNFLLGFIPFSTGFQTSDTEGEYIFVDKKQFERFLNDQPIVENPILEKSQTAAVSYIPIYLDLMLKAVKALDLSPDKRVNKDSVIDWLNKNWPAGLEGKSDRLIESMATLMRRPEDKKGGNTPWK